MNSNMHREITRRTLDAMKACGSDFWEPWRDEMIFSSNYPDMYYIGEAAASFEGWDPDWRELNQIPMPDGTARSVHVVCDTLHINETYEYPFVLLATRAMEAYKAGNMSLTARFMGVFSHLFADASQQAHIGANIALKKLFPQPGKKYCMHRYIESTEGEIPELKVSPAVFAESIPVMSWLLCARLTRNVETIYAKLPAYMTAMIADDTVTAKRIAGECAALACDLLADFLVTFKAIADGTASACHSVDIRNLRPVSTKGLDDSIVECDVLYDTIPGREFDKPIIMDIGYGPVKGICLLPNMAPGLRPTRAASADYLLPAGCVKRLTAKLGIARFNNPDQVWAYAKNETRAILEVLLDDKLVYRSQPLGDTDDAVSIDIPVNGARKLTLYMRDERDTTPVTKFFWLVMADTQLII